MSSLLSLSLSAISANLHQLPSTPWLVNHVQEILFGGSEVPDVQFTCLHLLDQLCCERHENKKALATMRLFPYLHLLITREKTVAWDTRSSPRKLIYLLNFMNNLESKDLVEKLLLRHIDYFMNGLHFTSKLTWGVTTNLLCRLTMSTENLIPIATTQISGQVDQDVIAVFLYHLHILLHMMEAHSFEYSDAVRLEQTLLILYRFSLDEGIFQEIERQLTRRILRGERLMLWMDVLLGISRSGYCSDRSSMMVERLCHRLRSPFPQRYNHQ